jgi:hypothetical protein
MKAPNIKLAPVYTLIKEKKKSMARRMIDKLLGKK